MQQLFYFPGYQALSSSGAPLPGAQLFFYQSGTTTAQVVYGDPARTTALSNPVVADSQGRFAQIYPDPASVYRVVLTDSGGVQQWLQDGVSFQLFPRTDAEIAATVTVVNYWYPPGVVERYGADPTGTNNSAAAINSALRSGTAAVAEFTYRLSPTDQILIPTGSALRSRTGRGVINVAASTPPSVTFTASVGGATSGTLTSAITNGGYYFIFSDGEVRAATVTGGTTASWSPALNAGTVTSATRAANAMSVAFTASVGGAGSGTLTAAIPNGTYYFIFSDGEARSVTVSGGTAASWSPVLDAGTITAANFVTATITVGEDAELSGFTINYPGQTTNSVAAIVPYPPTLTVATFGRARDLRVTGAFALLSNQSSFAEIFLEDIDANAMYLGLDFSGIANMGDTSRAHNVQIVLAGTFGFDGGAIDLWIRTYAIGVNTNLSSGNRIDGFQLSNFNVIGGSLGYNIGAGAWFQGNSVSADICTQSIYNAGQFYITNLWASVQDNHVDLLNIPAIRNNGGELQITGGRLGLQTANSQNALFIDSGTVSVANVWFATSRGGFGPCVYNQYGAVKLSGCTVSSTGSTGGNTRALSWQDCVIGNLSTGNPGFSIDGNSNPVGVTGPMSGSMPGFDMSIWSGGIPTGWTSNLSPSQYSTYFRDLFPIDGVHGIEVYGTSSGNFSLSYALPQLIDDVFGYYLVTFALKIIGAGSPAASVFDITLTDNSGANVYRLPISWTGVNSEALGIPLGTYFAFVGLLCAPLGSAAPGKVNFNFNFLTGTNQKYHIQTPVMFGMKPAPECSGAEYFSFQSCLPRDIQNGPTKYLRRMTAPTGSVGWNDGDTAQRNPQAVGSPKGWVYVASSGSWTSLGAL